MDIGGGAATIRKLFTMLPGQNSFNCIGSQIHAKI
jgi:hypothetical protein